MHYNRTAIVRRNTKYSLNAPKGLNLLIVMTPWHHPQISHFWPHYCQRSKNSYSMLFVALFPTGTVSAVHPAAVSLKSQMLCKFF